MTDTNLPPTGDRANSNERLRFDEGDLGEKLRETLQPDVDKMLKVLSDPDNWSVNQESRTQINHEGHMERLIQQVGGALLYVPGIGWHIYRGNIWKLDETNDVLRLSVVIVRQLQEDWAHGVLGENVTENQLAKWVNNASSLGTREAVLKLASADPRTKAAADQLNADPMKLAVLNGTLDLKTGQLRPSNPRDYITQQAAVSYDPMARCPIWDAHVRMITQREDGTPDPDMYAFLQRWAGYSLTGLVKEQKFAFLWGQGNNGKNVFIETLVTLLGTYGSKGPAKLLTGNGMEHETIIADLAGHRLVFVDETPKGTVNEARVKELTGSKRIKARKMRKDYFTFTARFKLWLSGNNRPRVQDTTDGFWRRLDLVPFDYQIPADMRVRDFDVQLLDELPGILNWCLDGLKAYQEYGLEPPSRVTAAGEMYREAENEFGQCVSDKFDRDSTQRVWIPNKVIHRLYVDWCEEQGIQKPRSIQQLQDDLKREGFQRCAKKARVKWTMRSETQPERGWFGPPPLSTPIGLAWTANTADLVPEANS